ncbi:CbiX/SirB N-terminal domain-containing protein [Halarcobacter sp.]|uniref:sirohydrochlorin chelatase n=1 Tax=Halarcobacter sp. TaxID=2321133 RepID=UPI002AAB90D5|nr:CbiX/SirB N-terminal domain-containing protein [Halarcobacter sp.]|eukprot:Anaeramoba_ignava/a91009_100.p6 GENE.a91009_100~~a91009_100.p6  ORF type:complete len:121 (+),score=17.52 a91009_100:1181-1543(+)
MKALIIIAHGSKKELSNSEFISMVGNIKNKDNNYDFVEASFLELASPSIEDITNDLIRKGVKELNYYPFFLNSGRHVISDIPNIIDKLKNENPNLKFELLEHFGKSDFIEDIILRDINIK